MQRSFTAIFALFCCLRLSAGVSNAVLTCTADIQALRTTRPESIPGTPFRIEGMATYVRHRTSRFFTLRDGTGSELFRDYSDPDGCTLHPGDRVRIDGRMSKGANSFFGACKHVTVLEHGPDPAPADIDIAEFLSGRHCHELVRIVGIVRDAFRGDCDPNFIFLTFDVRESLVQVAFQVDDDFDEREVEQLIGARVSVPCVCLSATRSIRRFMGPTFFASSTDLIRVLNEVADDPFAVAELNVGDELDAAGVAELGRRRLAGRVIAVWSRNRMMVRTADGSAVIADLRNQTPPKRGNVVEVSGVPDTDLFHINLLRARWRPADERGGLPEEEPAPDVIDDSQLKLIAGEGGERFRAIVRLHSHPVRIRGRAIRTNPEDARLGSLLLESSGCMIPIHADAFPAAMKDVVPDCEVEVSGICIMETAPWRLTQNFPHIRGFAVAVRSPDGIRVLSRPPWWTPSRLLAIIGALAVALLLSAAWAYSLRRLAERRGRELVKEEIARTESNLKVYERTRLAVELHDSIAQNLSGASLELEAAGQYGPDEHESALRHVGIAARTLKSCRDDLRNCIWDLRSETLEETDLNEAVRRTLAPHIGAARLAVRFAVPRDILSDNTAHALMSIIRELAINAVRHGGAGGIRVAGGIEDRKLLISVRDDGRGFDPDTAPGVRQGHFGLQGIRERVRKFNGTMRVESALGKGSKVTIALNLPNPEEKGNSKT